MSSSVTIDSSQISTREVYSPMSSNFSFKCKLDKSGKINGLAVDKIALINDGKFSNNLTKDSIIDLKNGLDNLIQNDPYITKNIYTKNTELEIKLKDNNLYFQKASSTNIIPDLFRYILRSTSPTPPPSETTEKLNKIHDKFLIDSVAHATALNNIAQLKKTTNTNTNKIKVVALLAFFTLGFLSFVVGMGGLLPHFGIPYLAKLSIPGIPISISAPLIGIGLIDFASIYGLKKVAEKNDKAKNYFEAVKLLRRQLFLDSNLNDIINAALFILMTLTMIHSPWLATLKGCLAYPTGALLITSGFMQLGESINSTINNKKTNETKEMRTSLLNVATSISVILMGLLTTVGMINSIANIIDMGIFGILMVSVNAIKLVDSNKLLKEINRDITDDEIYDFLKNKLLFLDETEIQKIKTEKKEMTEDEISKWITKNCKNFEETQAKTFQQMKEELEKAKTNEEKAILLEKIKKMIVLEEIKNATESKISKFGSIVNKSTLINSLEFFTKNSKIDLVDNNKKTQKLIKLFKTIKSEAKLKRNVEIFKLTAINGPLLFIPFLNMLNVIKLSAYNIVNAAELIANISVNAFPRFRNISPVTPINDSNIFQYLNVKDYQKFRNKVTESFVSETSEKTQALVRNVA